MNPHETKFVSALEYLDLLKQTYSYQPDIYETFLDIMKAFKTQTLSTPDVIERVKVLFRGQRALLQGFNAFLPQGHQISDADIEHIGSQPVPVEALANNLSTMSIDVPQNAIPSQFPQFVALTQPLTPEIDQARSFVHLVKTRFASNPTIYKQFLAALRKYHSHNQSIEEVYMYIAVLFHGHNDIIEQFKFFLPNPATRTGLVPPPVGVVPPPVGVIPPPLDPQLQLQQQPNNSVWNPNDWYIQ